MSTDFGSILRGLMDNRRLTARSVSLAPGRSESTINQLLAGAMTPTVELLQDLAPVLAVAVPDLLVVAGLPATTLPAGTGPYAATQEMGRLVAAASHLLPEQVERLVTYAYDLQRSGAPTGR